jgi:hypothetical protein
VSSPAVQGLVLVPVCDTLVPCLRASVVRNQRFYVAQVNSSVHLPLCVITDAEWCISKLMVGPG